MQFIIVLFQYCFFFFLFFFVCLFCFVLVLFCFVFVFLFCFFHGLLSNYMANEIFSMFDHCQLVSIHINTIIILYGNIFYIFEITFPIDIFYRSIVCILTFCKLHNWYIWNFIIYNNSKWYNSCISSKLKFWWINI